MSALLPLPLDWLRSLQEGTMPDACDVSRYVETNTADGVATDWATIATGVPCRVSVTSTGGTEAVGAGAAIRSVSDWVIHLPYGADVTPRDRLLVGARTFEVVRVDARSYETVRDCQCTEIV